MTRRHWCWMSLVLDDAVTDDMELGDAPSW
jgi:hypothetical protein